jgi:hypothetical protein
MGRLAHRTLHGDETLAEWSESDAGSYEAAAEVFRDQLASGLTAMVVEGAKLRPVTELPRDAELVLLSTAMGGG